MKRVFHSALVWNAIVAFRPNDRPGFGRQDCPRSNAPDRRAFTLLELMIVVVLIGIMAAMIVPEMRGTFEDALLRSASRELVNVFSIASSRAVSLNQTHRVRLDPRTGRYFLERKAEAEEMAPSNFVPARDVAGSEGRIDPRITIEFQRPEEDMSAGLPTEPTAVPDETEPVAGLDQAISFQPDGSADAIEILLQDRQGFRRLLRLNPTTARVSIVEPDSKLAAAEGTTHDEKTEVAR